MKKFAAILSVSMLAACVYAGNVDIWSGRNKIFQIWQTEDIFYYDTDADEEYREAAGRKHCLLITFRKLTAERHSY